MLEYLGLWVMIALAVNMWALISVLRVSLPWLKKAIWTLVLLVPVLGFLAWFLLGPRERAA